MDQKLKECLQQVGLAGLTEPILENGWTLETLSCAGNATLVDLGIPMHKLKEFRTALVRGGASPELTEGESGEWATTSDPAAATNEVPFLNSIGMLFVPIPRYKSLFSVCLTRIRDYSAFCNYASLQLPGADFPQTPEHPVVNVAWGDAVRFCEWLTIRDRQRGIISQDLSYRLPTDAEWSAAVGMPTEATVLPKFLSGATPGYPWGANFPPPPGAGNYHQILKVDPFPETSPVGSFSPNPLGLYDLGGNVWEMCQDRYDASDDYRVARGASCFNDGEDFLRSSHRNQIRKDAGKNNVGFRAVLSAGLMKDPLQRIARNPWG